MRTILAHTESVEAFFSEKKHNLLKIPGLRRNYLNQINREAALKMAEPYVEYFAKKPFQSCFFQSERFPARLNNCDDAPLLLFSYGEMNLNPPRIVSIVGTRHASDYGKAICEELLHSFVDKNIIVVSGLAYGIDIYVHQLCVKLGIQTIGVLGHGLDRVYPSAHKHIASQMTRNGGLLTEFLPGTTPDRMNFPMRNRIVAGMCDATIVVESGEKGGSLITAELANDYSRDVFAFPGDIDRIYSRGCNRLIQEAKAHLITSSRDFFRIMNWEEKPKPPVQQKLFEQELTDEQSELVRLLGEKESSSIDYLTVKSGFTPGIISTALLELELSGIIKSMPGKRYKLL